MTEYVRFEGADSTNQARGDISLEVTNNGLPTSLNSQLAGERFITGDNYAVANPECTYSIATADANISSSLPATLYGVMVIAATATNVIEIRDATAAAGGTVVLSIPASTAAGTYFNCNGIKLTTGLYADFTGTGTIRIDWRETGA